ncbi:Pyridoxal 5'-phosphate synthase-like subunit PDX1.2 [Forsythia ovata]|uniref:Pyridoxal 5'-phosphate synthase-like subunit PDX1.2 n=1 Tax=Forsythia ovata TaxID=205694 RepID=A0ABD1X097_9LAMI
MRVRFWPLRMRIKHIFRLPFVCGCRDLGEALRRVEEGAAMLRTQWDMKGTDEGDWKASCAAGGIVTPADAAMMMLLGCDGVFLGADVFNSSNPYKRILTIVQAVQNYDDPRVLGELSIGFEDANMP